MGRPVAVTKSLTAGSVNAIATAQSLAGAALLNLNGASVSGGVALLGSQRRVIITSVGNDTGITWTVTGTNDGGAAIKDTFAGANVGLAAQSNLDFSTVTSIRSSGATAGNVQAGTNTVGSCPWVRVDPHLNGTLVSINAQLVAGGAGNIDIQYTNDEFLPAPQGNSAIAYAPANTVPTVMTLLGGVVASTDQSPITTPCLGWRFTINSGTSAWTVTGTQAGISGP